MGGDYLRLRYAYAVLFGLLTTEQLISAILASSFGLQRRGAFLADVAVVPVLILWIVHVPIWAVISRKPQPTRYILETYSKNLIWFAFVAVLLAFAFFKAANVAKIKTVIPEIVPFYADPFLAQLDRAIFFTDPWKITHFFLGDAATWLIDQIYLSWHFIQIVFGCWMLLTRNLRLQTTALISYTSSWLILGGVFAVLFSSVGPCFYEHFYGDRYFRPLMDSLTHAPRSGEAMKYLLDSYNTGNLGSGISAFPSMHVAIAVWEVLIIQMAFRNRFLTLAAALYAGLIFIGSVHLGWHYAVDGIFSAVCVVVIWKVSERVVAYVPRSTRLRPADALVPTQEN